MFASIDRSPRRRNRAVTLIEAVLYISIALALIVGGLVFYQQASTAAKTSTMVRQLSAILAETRILINGAQFPQIPEYDDDVGSMDLIPTLIAAGAVPQDMITSATSLSHPFGGALKMWGAMAPINDGSGLLMQPQIGIELRNIPQNICARLVTATSGSDQVAYDWGNGFTTLVSYGTFAISVQGDGDTWSGFPSRMYAMNPTQAGWMCKYGSAAYSNKAVQPTRPPFSGNVTVLMFLFANTGN
jgi:hypothetical protein